MLIKGFNFRLAIYDSFMEDGVGEKNKRVIYGGVLALFLWFARLRAGASEVACKLRVSARRWWASKTVAR